MKLTDGKRAVAVLCSAILPGSGQLLKRDIHKGIVYLAAFVVLALLCWPIRLPETYLGLIGVKIGAIALAVIASLDAWVRGAKGTRRYLIVFPVLAALLLGDVATSAIVLAEGFHILYVPGSAMEPTVLPDRVVADEQYYERRKAERGDIVLLNYNVLTMKRVVAVGGDVIQGFGDQVLLNGKPLVEPYVQHTGSSGTSRRPFGPVRVLPGKVFLMGDNRDFSLDSRYPIFGQMSVQALLGKVLYVCVSKTPGRWGKKIW